MSDQPSTKTDAAQDPELTLEESIDALLEEVSAACDRFENPDSPPSPGAPVSDTSTSETAPDPRPEPGSDSQAEPESVSALHAHTVAEQSSAGEPDQDAGAQAEAALEQVELNAEDLLGQAADQLLDDIESEDQRGAETVDTPPDSQPEPDESIDEALAAAADDLLEDLSFDEDEAPVGTDTPEPDPASGQTTEPAPASEEVDDDDLLGDAIDGLLNESETPDAPEASIDETIDLPNASSDEDPLDGEAFDALLDGTEVPTPEPDPVLREPVAAPEPDPAAPGDTAAPSKPHPEPDPDLVAERSAEPAAAPEPAPETTSPPEPLTEAAAVSVPAERMPSDAPGFLHRMAVAVRERTPTKVLGAWAWLMPRGAAAAHTSAKVSAPLGARALMLMSKPLEKQPTKVRDSIGWVALWTAFLAVCVWGYLLLRPTEQRLPDADATGIAAIESDAGTAQP